MADADKEPAVAPEIVEFGRRIAALGHGSPVTYALIAINAIMFAVMAFEGAGLFEPDGNVHLRWGSNYVPATLDGDGWRLATSRFLHFGIAHMAVNMWVLYANGQLTERLFGSIRFLLLSLFAGLAGSLARAWWHASANSAGASGAIFGVLGGVVAYLLAMRYRIPQAVLRAQGRSIAIFIVFNVAFGATHPGIDNAAHAGGFVAGFLIGLAFARPLDAGARSQPQTLRVAGIGVAAALLLVAAAQGVLYAKERLPPAERFAAAEGWFVYREPGVMADYNALAADLRAGTLDGAEFAGRLEAGAIPFFVRAAERFAPEVVAAAPPERRPLGRYVTLRLESMQGMARALRDDDPAELEHALARSREADALITAWNEAAVR
jgi:membrane associated rhomboid family serine protease